MNKFLTILKLLTCSLLLSRCSTGGTQGYLLGYPSKEPEFLDGGKTADSLMQVFRIDYFLPKKNEVNRNRS